MPAETGIGKWEDIRAKFAKKLCHIYCEAENKATKRKAFSFGDFQLANGSLSQYYFDFRTIYAYPDYLDEIVDMLVKCVKYNIPSAIQRIAGIPNASLGLASLLSAKLRIPSFYCHMKEIFYDEPRYAIQGSLEKGDNVLVIDDLTTTGLRKTETIDIIERNGGQVSYSLVIIDRQEGSEENLEKRNIVLLSLLKASEFAKIARDEELITEEQRNTILHYIQKRREKDGLPSVALS